MKRKIILFAIVVLWCACASSAREEEPRLLTMEIVVREFALTTAVEEGGVVTLIRIERLTDFYEIAVERRKAMAGAFTQELGEVQSFRARAEIGALKVEFALLDRPGRITMTATDLIKGSAVLMRILEAEPSVLSPLSGRSVIVLLSPRMPIEQ